MDTSKKRDTTPAGVEEYRIREPSFAPRRARIRNACFHGFAACGGFTRGYIPPPFRGECQPAKTVTHPSVTASAIATGSRRSIDDMLLLNALAARSLLFQGMGSMTSQPATMALSTVEASHSVEAVRAANAIGLLDGPFFLVLSGLAFARAELTT